MGVTVTLPVTHALARALIRIRMREFWRHFDAKEWRMAVVLKTSAKNRPESSDSDRAIGYI
jgi:hypothetical protein